VEAEDQLVPTKAGALEQGQGSCLERANEPLWSGLETAGAKGGHHPGQGRGRL